MEKDQVANANRPRFSLKRQSSSTIAKLCLEKGNRCSVDTQRVLRNNLAAGLDAEGLVRYREIAGSLASGDASKTKGSFTWWRARITCL